MPPRKPTRPKPLAKPARRSTQAEVRAALAWLKARGTKRNVEGMARYGITARRVFGVSVAKIHILAKKLGKDHALAQALWASGWYEARMLAAFVDEPAQLTLAQMDAWAGDFDNWAVCDTACFHLFDRSPLAFRAAKKWARAKPEFVKRAGFALMASLPHHNRSAPDKAFLPFLPLIEKGAQDERNFVKKGVSWALRGIGRRSPALYAAALPVARRLAASKEAAPRWVGKDALRELTSPAVRRQLRRSSG